MRNRLSIVFTLLLCLLGFQLEAQRNRVAFERISVEEGLSQSSAFSIVQDDVGYIWIATFDGLNRYDGYFIEVFKHDQTNEFSLADNYVQNLCIDAQGILWIGTNSKGLCYYDYQTNKFHSLNNLDSRNALKGISILSLKELDDETLVVLTEEGINLLDINTHKCSLISEKEYLTIKNAPSLLSYFNKKTDSGKVITCTLSDSKDEVWVGTENGLERTRKGTNVVDIYKNVFYNPFSLSSNEITCVFEDRGNVMWIGTSLGGICKWDRYHENLELYRNEPFNMQALSSSKIRSFYEDSKHRVWIGTVGGGLNLWDREKNQFSSWSTKSNVGLNSDKIRDVIEWEKSYIVATDGGGIQRFNPEDAQLRFVSVDMIPKDARVWDLYVEDDDLWVATYNYGLFLINESGVTNFENEIATEKVTWVSSGGQGIVWVGTFGEGLYRIKGEDIKNWNTENSDLSDDRIYSIVPDKENDLWIATKGGVNYFDLKSGKIICYSTKEGLPNETVMGIIHGDNSDIWFSTNRGICHFFPEKNVFENYDIRDGLQNNEFLIHSFLKLHSGEILFGGINGFNVFPIKGLIKNKYQPQIVITDFKVNGVQWGSGFIFNSSSEIELDHDQNEFSFEFSALSFVESEKNTYEYQLVGYDKEWKKIGTRRFVQYTNLPPGNYLFKVRAANNDGVWNKEPATISIIIHPAFWQTLWFKIVIAVGIAVLLLVLYRIRIRRIVKKNLWLEDEIEKGTKEISEKNVVIEGALYDIQSSINYAKRIQSAILPPIKTVKEFLPDSFILYKPKDVIAGDFYWLKNKGDDVIFAVADCTGHGVPGALISVVCNYALNRSVREFGLTDPGKILDQTREIVSQEFEKSDEDVRDGMDIALCAINGNILKYAGANNPLWIVRNGEIIETKANRQPIGKLEDKEVYKTHVFELQKGDTIYAFSDGYVDQFGGEKGKKFKPKAFRALLLSIQEKTMEEQKEVLELTFENWRGDLEQVDDVCVMGLRY